MCAERMGEMNVQPDAVTFNTLINGYAQRGHADDAERLLELMQKKGLEPDTVTLNTMMVALLNGGRAAEVKQVMLVCFSLCSESG